MSGLDMIHFSARSFPLVRSLFQSSSTPWDCRPTSFKGSPCLSEVTIWMRLALLLQEVCRTMVKEKILLLGWDHSCKGAKG